MIERRSWDAFRRSCSSMLEAMGNTPLVRLNKIPSGVGAQVYCKLEWYGPTGSLKDRIYYNMITQAEARGELKAGMTVLECSTGNAGTACAWVAALKGYRCVITMPTGMSEERKKLMAAYGAELVFTPGAESDVDLALEKAFEIKAQDPERYWVPNQFDNDDNVQAHYLTTGPEIWEQSEGKVEALVGTQGSGGSITGIAQYLQEQNPKVQLWAVEPSECPLLSERRWGSHGIEGIGDGLVPRNLHLQHVTGIITTSTEEAVAIAQRMVKEEGIFCGISSGSNVAAAMKLAKRRPDLRYLVCLVNDTGQRYFSTALCGEVKEVEIPEREHPLDGYTVEQLDQYQAGWEVIR
ncbi:MAG: PLP-dependent cysteine synthase family protein [Nitrospinota bacterium]